MSCLKHTAIGKRRGCVVCGFGSLGANPFICPFANGDRQEYGLHNIKASVNLTMTISDAVSALGDRTLVWMSFVVSDGVSKMRFQLETCLSKAAFASSH